MIYSYFKTRQLSLDLHNIIIAGNEISKVQNTETDIQSCRIYSSSTVIYVIINNSKLRSVTMGRLDPPRSFEKQSDCSLVVTGCTTYTIVYWKPIITHKSILLMRKNLDDYRKRNLICDIVITNDN